ncbi:MAG: methyltransferase [Leucobacter sp.]|nr:methyltransferase [Leucobacter sp.]
MGSVTELEAFLARLSREPDIDAPELQAYDAADLLLLDAARSLKLRDGDVVVVGDRHGALTLGLLHETALRGLRVHQDGVLGERALTSNATRVLGASPAQQTELFQHHPLGSSLFGGATLVVMQLPRSLSELEEIAWHIATHASPDVVVIAGGRDKHMSHSMNERLGRYFGEVTASRGWRKARMLTARGAIRPLGDPPFALHARDPELDFDLFAFGATFGGTAFDHGSRLLVQTLRERPPSPDPTHIVDLGCGNGVLAVTAALQWPRARVLATDQSAAAVAATKLTAQAAGVADRVEVHRADATDSVPTGWADLVLLNPPFHTGATVHTAVAHRLMRAVPRVLQPGGELRLVFNSGLGYRPLVERIIGPTTQLARNRTFTVLSSIAR